MSKFVSRILTPYAKNAESFLMNTQHFCERFAEVTIADDEILVSFDVKSLYTLVPIEGAIVAIREILEPDANFETHANISVETLIEMVRICLGTTSFQFRDDHFELTDGSAMGSPLSSAVANIYMAKFEETAIQRADPKFS